MSIHRIKRASDIVTVKAILHRVADIPAGVGVHASVLGGEVLYEGTPIGYGDSGLFDVLKTAQVVTAYVKNATSLEVAKGHHFVVGDTIGTSASAGVAISAIDKSQTAKDVITLPEGGLSAAIAVNGCVFQTNGTTTSMKVTPVALAGESKTVNPNDNLGCSAWVMAVVREGNAPAVNDTIKGALKGVIYVK